MIRAGFPGWRKRGRPKVIALKTIYAQCLKPSHLCWGFDAFGDGKNCISLDVI